MYVKIITYNFFSQNKNYNIHHRFVCGPELWLLLSFVCSVSSIFSRPLDNQMTFYYVYLPNITIPECWTFL